MALGRARIWIRRMLATAVLALVVAGVWAGSNWNSLQAKYAAHRLKRATTDDDRTHWADELAARDDSGPPLLIEFIRTGDPPLRAAAAAALGRRLAELPESDPRATALCGQLLEAFANCDSAGRDAVLELLPPILKHGSKVYAAQCRAAIAAGLNAAGVAPRLAAVRAAMHPDVRLRAEVLPLLGAAEPEVRRAALFAVGPVVDADPVIGDEELFHWLHDPDEDVRKVCRDALVSRGRGNLEISFGRRLAHPDAAERLKLLLDLRDDDELTDPEPWLERLSRDVDPGVRAGSARVMLELNAERELPAPAWVVRLAEADADPTVRKIAHFYRLQLLTRPDPHFRPAGAP